MKALTKLAAAGAGIAGGAYAAYVGATWLRYGRVPPSQDPLLDRFMPTYEVGHRHSVDVAAAPDVTLAVAKEVDFGDARMVRAIFRARELILRSKPDTETRPRGLIEAMKSIGWTVLADEPGEIVMGAATKPWEANPVFRPIPPGEFATFAEPGYVKIVWTLRADPAGEGASRFTSETRAIATDPEARMKFRWYWAFLSPGILLIRWAMTPLVRTEATRRMQSAPVRRRGMGQDPSIFEDAVRLAERSS